MLFSLSQNDLSQSNFTFGPSTAFEVADNGRNESHDLSICVENSQCVENIFRFNIRKQTLNFHSIG